MGHTPITIDYRLGDSVLWDLLFYFKRWVLYLYKRNGEKPHFERTRGGRTHYTDGFIRNNINTTARFRYLNILIPFAYRLDCVITGSDQVWRPKYNIWRYTYLSFVGSNITKIAYAASFGVDYWEYTPEQTKQCKALVKSFKAVSTREKSGVLLCKEHLDADASHVLDPTLLLARFDYESICSSIPLHDKPFLFAYILDLTDTKKKFVERMAPDRGVTPMIVSAESSISTTIEEWLSYFRDSEFVITDSFHGTVFSIIFNREFISIPHPQRGLDRFVSLLETFNWQNRLHDGKDQGAIGSIDWGEVNNILKEKQQESQNFLLKNIS